MNRRFRVIVAASLVALAALGGCEKGQSPTPNEPGTVQNALAPTAAVTTALFAARPVPTSARCTPCTTTVPLQRDVGFRGDQDMLRQPIDACPAVARTKAAVCLTGVSPTASRNRAQRHRRGYDNPARLPPSCTFAEGSRAGRPQH
jgi:hypothetical protein